MEGESMCLENCLVLHARQEVEPGSLQQPQHSTQIYQIYVICGAPGNFSAAQSFAQLTEGKSLQLTFCKHNNTLCGISTISKPY
jgi:hypothetical protein